MARIDDYINAKKISVDLLAKDAFDEIAQRTGFETLKDNIFRVPFLDRVYNIAFPDFEFSDELKIESDIPIQEQVLILHYMERSGSRQLTGKRIAYREIKGASFYFSAFKKRAIDPLRKVFGNNIKGLVKAAEALKGNPTQPGDAGFEFYLFPKTPLQLVLWEGDNEFEPEANILFDDNIGDILSPEDIAWLAGMLVYRLIRLEG